MAIKMRRGAYADFDPSKLEGAELAVVQQDDPNTTDGKAVYIAFQPGQAKRLATYEDIQNEVAQVTEDIAQELTQEVEAAIADDVQAAQTAATNASTSAQTATTKASEAAASATQAAQTVANIIDNTLTQTGKAADAKVTGDKLTGLKEDLNTLEGSELPKKVNQPLSGGLPAYGTSGQLLRTNGDGTTQWVDQGLPTDEQTADAVESWLDDHPEATTTVQDGAITWTKLNSAVQGEINDKAPAIFVETAKSKTFSAGQTAVIQHWGELYLDGDPGDEVAVGFAENVVSDVNEETKTLWETMDIDISANGVVVLNGYVGSTKQLYIHKSGSATASELDLSKNVESGAVLTLGVLVKGTIEKTETTSGAPILTIVTFYYTDGTNASEAIRMSTYAGLNSRGFTVPENKTVYRVRVMFQLHAKWAYDCTIAFGMLVSGEWATATIPSSGRLIYSASQITSGFSSMPYKSYIKYIADTKNYIDDHMPSGVVTYDELEVYEPTTANQHYVTPEMYGAKGDGTTDDTAAFQACINAAIAGMIPLKAFGIYKTSQTLTFAQSPSNTGKSYTFEINRIIYSGTDNYAIVINGACGRFIFGRIKSSQKGIQLISVSNGAILNYIFANYIYSDGDCFTADGGTGGTNYNTIRILRAYSVNGNCLVTGNNAGENRYFDTSCVCPNGWAVYGGSGRYYNIGMESNAKNGIYLRTSNAANFYGMRWAELMDTYEAGVRGTVLKVVGEGVHVRVNGPELPVHCIDVSEMTKKADLTNSDYAYKGLIISGSVVAPRRNIHIGREAYIRCGKIICVPEMESSYTVTESDLDLKDTAYNTFKGYPTRFVINATTCDIHLSDSYCPIGYSSFIVDQSTSGKICRIFKSDDDVNPIFDGSQLGVGVYQLKSYVTGNSSTPMRYDTTNDAWAVTKIS